MQLWGEIIFTAKDFIRYFCYNLTGTLFLDLIND